MKQPSLLENRASGPILQLRRIVSTGLVLGFWILLIVLCVLLFRQDTSLRAQQERDGTPVAVVGQTQEQTIALLEAELDSVRRTDERLLQVVYWTLGTVAGVVAILIAFSWFANVRLSERDRLQVRQELKQELENDVGTIRSELEKRVDELEKQSSEALRTLIDERERHLVNRMETITEEFRLEAKTSHFLLLQVAARLESNLSNYRELFRIASGMVGLGVQSEDQEIVVTGLELMRQALDDPSVIVFPEDDVQARTVIDGLPGRFATQCQLIRERLLEVQRYPSTEGSNDHSAIFDDDEALEDEVR